jgi:nitrogen fixation protein NifB
MISSYPFDSHPCWAENRHAIHSRLHLPVAPDCNVRCIYCNPKLGASCHITKPGISERVMTVQEAVDCAVSLIESDSSIKIIGISGPGEPLYNASTFEVLFHLRDMLPHAEFCLSTNGLLLQDKLPSLLESGVKTISVSVSAIRPETASKIYKYLIYHGTRYLGDDIGTIIIQKQLAGISSASNAGIHVKVNSILMTKFNEQEMIDLSRAIRNAGAKLQNIIPLVPCYPHLKIHQPSSALLNETRSACSKYIRQFRHCAMCRSDVFGVPGNDKIIPL